MNRWVTIVTTGVFCLFLTGCAESADDGNGNEADKQNNADAWATLLDSDDETLGKARIQEGPEGVVIRLSLDGLAPGWKAIHIHEKGTCEDHHDGFVASGGHLDPHDRKHGLLNVDGPELGDLPNIWVHDDGRVKAEIYAPGVTLNGDGNGLLSGDGTALVIHENQDDHQSQPIGGAGSRVACGVVESD